MAFWTAVMASVTAAAGGWRAGSSCWDHSMRQRALLPSHTPHRSLHPVYQALQLTDGQRGDEVAIETCEHVREDGRVWIGLQWWQQGRCAAKPAIPSQARMSASPRTGRPEPAVLSALATPAEVEDSDSDSDSVPEAGWCGGM